MELSLRASSILIALEASNQYRIQDRQVRKGMINKIKEFLDDSKRAYKEVSSLENSSLELEGICKGIKLNRLRILQNIQDDYINELNFLRDIGADISNYSRYLSKGKIN